jgi:hypothetical protein
MPRKHAAVLILTAGLLAAATPASAGFLDMLFGGFRRAAPSASRDLPQLSPVPTLPAPSGADNDSSVRTSSGPRSAYCVRTCDGHYFPVQANGGVSAAQMCNTFCPASETRLYSGGGIDYAVASDGKHYRDLPKAFLYRKQMVAGCTCNGKDAFGLAKMDVKEDPTLARGDIVVTQTGLASVSGRDRQGPQLTPVVASRSLSDRERDRLGESRTARERGGPAETTGAAPADD